MINLVIRRVKTIYPPCYHSLHLALRTHSHMAAKRPYCTRPIYLSNTITYIQVNALMCLNELMFKWIWFHFIRIKVSLIFYRNLCNTSRSWDYATQRLIIVSLTLSQAKTHGSQSLAKTQGSIFVRIIQRFMKYSIFLYTGESNWPDRPVRATLK